jgi:hypothetical protein
MEAVYGSAPETVVLERQRAMNVPVVPNDLLLDEAQFKAALGKTVLHCYPKLHPTHARSL